MTDVVLSVGPAAPAVAATQQLTRARGRKATFRLDGIDTCTLTMNGLADDASRITPMETDLWVWRDGTLLHRGRFMPVGADIGETKHTVTHQTIDYRGMLHYRQIGAAGRYFAPGTDQGALVWTLIQESQALTGGNWGITNGLGAVSGTTRELTLKAAAKLDEEIGKLGRLDNGFDWEISPLLELNRWYPTRDNGHGVVVDHGGLASRVRYNVDPSADYGNHALVTGKDGLTPVSATSATIASDPRGRIEVSEAYPTVEEQATLNARAPQLLADIEVLRPTYLVTLAQEKDDDGQDLPSSRWKGPAHIWKGDTVNLSVHSGWLNVDDEFRVLQLEVAWGDSGSEVVTLGLVPA